ncbi:regulatory protein ArsR [Thermoproteus uzoniensis 768-20]|uniref:Regulatory protein ArsR n=2 Tax=Thermoproteus TaxID=2270 RepID=F2L5A2_THEU7|nr:regulatory protein ArsR [Thermoproteus uzoniensis 768-20]
MRSKILMLLKERPTNINQISKELGIDYKTVKYHLSLLEKNGLVKRLGMRYGDVYFIEDNAYKHWDELYTLIKESLSRNETKII